MAASRSLRLVTISVFAFWPGAKKTLTGTTESAWPAAVAPHMASETAAPLTRTAIHRNEFLGFIALKGERLALGQMPALRHETS